MVLRLAVALVALAVTGCLPYPIHSPRVDPGVAVGAVMGFRGIVIDTGQGRPQKFALVPEVGFSSSVGFGRADGTGPALRASWAIGFPNLMAGDVYAELPHAGPLLWGGGMLVSPPHAQEDHRSGVRSPYATLGWQRKDETMLYGSMAWYVTHRQTRPESTVTAQGIILGFQRRYATRDGTGSLWRRFYVALFHANRNAESMGGFDGGSIPLRSLMLVGSSFDAVWPFRSARDYPK